MWIILKEGGHENLRFGCKGNNNWKEFYNSLQIFILKFKEKRFYGGIYKIITKLNLYFFISTVKYSFKTTRWIFFQFFSRWQYAFNAQWANVVLKYILTLISNFLSENKCLALN